MGVYDKLFVPRPVPCPQCGSEEELVIQFHFGDVQLNHFRVGDAVTWSDTAEGEPRTGRFEILGYPEFCPTCGRQDGGFFLVEFDGDVITGYRRATEEDMDRFEW
ncbi:hypothetical protein ACWCWD_13475 [Streptomyces sp. NPDC001493]